MRMLGLALAALAPTALWAEILVPVRTIRARDIISPDDLVTKPDDRPGALADPAEIVGMEARVTLYAGRPVHPDDIGPPAIIERNDIVTLVFDKGGLRILAEGRALGRGAAGETVRAMNNTSRSTVAGRVRDDGLLEVN